MTETTLKWGTRAEHRTDAVALWWNEVRAETPAALLKTAATITDHGLYAFEGRSDGYPLGAILYVGQCGAKDDAGGKAGQPLGKRIHQSFTSKFLYTSAKHGPFLYSDCWDITLRWARADVDLILDIESLLVRMHAPPFNRQHVRGYLPPKHNLLVLNGGAKGRLVPNASSLWFHAAPWPEPPA